MHPEGARILERLARLRSGATLCPGMLARDVGMTPGRLREALRVLEREERIVARQRGRAMPLDRIKGPYRVAPAPPVIDDLFTRSAYAGCIGIDYSGAGRPEEAQSGIRVFAAQEGEEPRECRARPEGPQGWSRVELHAWLRRLLDAGAPFLIGIDHGLGLPWEHARRQRLDSWEGVLEHARRRWPTDRLTVREARERTPFPPVAEGYRLCDLWAGTAKSLFHFDVPGSVASSTAAGLPWIARLRRECAGRAHFWPFDGWVPPRGKSVIAEVYPSLWRRRWTAPSGLGADQRDAWTVAAWLQWAQEGGHLERYWQPPLAPEEKARARLEGWILGVA
jgi:DNA-binding transcriptional ArsR family regulator